MDNFFASYNGGSGGSVAGVSSLNGMTGALTLVAGTGITITPGSGTLTIDATGGGAFALQDLSNLTNPTHINQNLTFLASLNGTTPRTVSTGNVSLANEIADDLTVRPGDSSATNGVAGTLTLRGGNGPNPGGVSINSGNSTNGPPSGGNISIATGTGNGGRGLIFFHDGTEGTPGNVWTEGANPGEGHWSAPSPSSPGGASGNVQFNNGGTFDGSNNLSWDNSSAFLGIGTNSPAVALDVKSQVDGYTMRIQGSGPGGGAAIELDASLNSSGGKNYAFFSSGSSNGDIGANNWAVKDTTISGLAGYGLILNATGTGLGGVLPTSALEVKGELRLDGSSSGYTGLMSPAAASSTTYTLPAADGSSGDVLSTDGSGVLSFITPTVGATVSLNNLSATSINADLLPNTTNTKNLGSSTKNFNTAHVRNIHSATSIAIVPQTNFSVSAASGDIDLSASGHVLLEATGDQVYLRPNVVVDMSSTNAEGVRLRFADGGGAGSNYTELKAANTLSTSTTYTLPAVDGSSGDVLSTDGSGILSFITPAAAGANTALSNLASTAVNANISPGTTNVRNLGISSQQWLSSSILRNTSFFGSDFMLSGYITSASVAFPVSGMGIASNSDVANPFYVITALSSVADANPTQDISITTGNKTAGTGNSGNINLATGSSSGGTQGAITMSALYAALPTGTSDPTAPAGSVYYNTGSNKLRLFDGSTWVDLN